MDKYENHSFNLKSDLLFALDGIKSRGTFASFGALPWFDPQVYVYGVIKITLPLSRSQAEQLKDKAHQAPYGKGSETIVDTSVRNTWELDPGEHFELENRGWRDYVKRCCVSVAEDLDISSPITAKLYKMLIYEKGAMFKPHTDTEKVPGMFGTLIFKTSEYQTSYACWYSDVHHEVLPVTSGYRWALTYNLVLDPSRPSPRTDIQTQFTSLLHGVISEWVLKDQDCREIGHVYYKLDHEYTQASISLNTLKRQDRAKVESLQKISLELPVDIFLAVLEKHQMGSCKYQDRYYRRRYNRYSDWDDDYQEESNYKGFHPLEDVHQTDYKILPLMDLEGRKVLEDMTLDRTNILQNDCFNGIPKEDYMGYMGNYGPEATHWYRAATVLIVPRDSTVSFLMNSSNKNMEETLESMIGHFAGSILNTLCDQSSLGTLKNLCEEFWKLDSAVLPRDVITNVVKVAFQSKDPGFFGDAALNHEEMLSLDFFKWARNQILAGHVTFDTVKDGLFNAAVGYPELYQWHLAVAFFAPPNQPISEEIRAWVTGVHDQILKLMDIQSLDKFGVKDGYAVVQMVRAYYDFDYLTSQIIPIVRGKFKSSSFVLGLLCRLFEYTREDSFPTEEGTELFKEIGDMLIRKLEISTLCSVKQDKNKSGAAAFAHFIGALIQLSSDDADSLATTNNLFEKVVDAAPSIDKSAFHTFWLPFLHALMPFVDVEFINRPASQRYQKLFASILKAYITNYVGEEPEFDTNFARPPVRCSCTNCRQLNYFLQNNSQKVGRFPLNGSERHHIHTMLDSSGIRCTHETERLGSPFTLVVVKLSQNEKVQREWLNRKSEATRQLATFDQNKLSLVLGEVDYVKIMNMDISLGSSATTSPSSGTPRSGRLAPNSTDRQYRQGAASSSLQASRPAAGVKRKIEVIDLTGDD